ncbi:type II toxin-antitoxin system VapC family toxin [Candidatus Micrarchaeota archaeon]|nr:type II toxin-antitoxin system VapC family toxin [Candidatus Micrarchaeota archaeon]
MVVLDTTFIIHFLKNKQSALRKVKTLSSDVFTTRINVFEVLVGIYFQKSDVKEKELKIFYAFLDSITILELDATSTDGAARISAELKQKGQDVNETDALIAAIALTNGENVIITENVKHFSRIPGITAENY